MPVQVCHRLQLSALALAATVALLACGGNGSPAVANGTGGEAPPADTGAETPTANAAPTAVGQPEVAPGPLGSGRASATWAPASDDATAESALVYQLHASTQADFTPGADTLLFEGTGMHQASVASGLLAGTRYTFKLVVKDAQGLATTGAGASATMYTATPHSGVTDQQCYAAGGSTLLACSEPGALALNSQQDGHRTAVNPMSYSEVPKPGGGFYARTECVQDNVTGLIWEGKEASGLRAGSNTYTNYSDPTQPQKWNGSAYVNPTQAEIDAASNSVGYVNHVNGVALCGHADWRLPTVDELQSIVDYSKPTPGPTVNSDWFPHAYSKLTWTSSRYGGPDDDGVWYVYFSYGSSGFAMRGYPDGAVRVVRDDH